MTRPMTLNLDKPEWTELCLSADPFAGDFEGGRILSDQVVRVRVQDDCHTCCGPVLKGTFVRRMGTGDDAELLDLGDRREGVAGHA